MARIASNDPVFVDGFSVEDVDEQCWQALSPLLKELVLREAAAGNKAMNITGQATPRRVHVLLSGPARTDITNLPDALVLRKGFDAGYPVYDDELYGIWDTASLHSVTFMDPFDPGIPGLA